MASLNNLFFAFFCLSIGVLGCNALETIRPNNNVTITYEVVDNRTINFSIEATAAGWVALGLNSQNASMYGADFFMGAVGAQNATSGGDYHVTNNATIRRPQPDTVQNWVVNSGLQTNGTGNVPVTKIEMSRLLDTGDSDQDVTITNSTINLLWSYHNTSDDITVMHTSRGSVEVNLLRTSSFEGIVEEGESDEDDVTVEDESNNATIEDKSDDVTVEEEGRYPPMKPLPYLFKH